MRNRALVFHILHILLYFLLCFSTVRIYGTVTSNSPCVQINKAFKQVAESNEPEACQCFPETSPRSGSHLATLQNLESYWIGCTRQKMPQVFGALNALNETMVSKLWIWDSVINIIPADMFAQVRPRVLSVERSGLSLFRPGAFSNIGRRLRVLQLRNNIIKRIEPVMFKDLDRLKALDLGGNKISAVITGELDLLKNLETLILNDNQIAMIEDGACASLTNLRHLNLANNKLSNITAGTFRGLNSLESLDLHSNDIVFVDWNAFAHMKNLKYLNLGSNHITRINLWGLKSLEKLYINNNSVQSMKNITLRDLKSLTLVSLDRNFISEILDGDLHSIGESARLGTFTVAANKISKVEARALEPIHQITTLSLQNNQLSSISVIDGAGNLSFLLPLKKLRRLYLSNNNLVRIEKDDLSGLNSLEVLALDHNHIEEIHEEALNGLRLSRFYLNRNRLYYLSEKFINVISLDRLSVIDFSDNLWLCVCGEEWLADWVASLGERNVADGNMGCLKSRACAANRTDQERRSILITVIASILAVVSLFVLVAIAFLYVEDGKRVHKFSSPLKRVPSDLLQLISDGSSLSLPYDSGIEPLLTNKSTNKVQKVPLITGGQLSLSSVIRSPIILKAGDDTLKVHRNNGEKKRVRFTDT